MPTNLIAIAMVVLSTNTVENVHPSGTEKVRIEVVTASVKVPGWSTNVVKLSTNITRFVWKEVPLKPERNPLGMKDMPPPLPPPGVTNK